MHVVTIFRHVTDRMALHSSFKMLGHSYSDHDDFHAGVNAITSKTDLVLAEPFLGGMDPVGMAFLVSSALGGTRPRLVLVTDKQGRQRLESLPPDLILGVLVMPLTTSKVYRLIRFLEHACTACPGVLTRTLCENGGSLRGDKVESVFCMTREYGRCPTFKSHCGRRVHEWFSAQEAVEGEGSGGWGDSE